MTYSGRVDRGVVVFDGPSRPPDGVRVRVEELELSASVGEDLDKLAGKAQGLPADVAQRHDQYRREHHS